MRYLLIACFFIYFYKVKSQCWNVRDDNIEKVTRLFQEGKKDSISTVLGQWEDKCEITEELFRLKILDAIENGFSLQNIMDENAIGFIRSFETKKGESLIPYFYAGSLQGSFYSDEINLVTKKWAEELNPRDMLDSAFILLYSEEDADTFWNSLRRGEFEGNVIQDSFAKLVLASKTEKWFHVALISGGSYFWNSSVVASQIGIQLKSESEGNIGIFSTLLSFDNSSKIELKFKGEENPISAKSWTIGYDYGKLSKHDKFENTVFLSLSNTIFLSEYSAESENKRAPAVLGLGMGTSFDYEYSDNKLIGLELKLFPINYSYSSRVDMKVPFISLALKWSSRNSRISQEFLLPIGFYK